MTIPSLERVANRYNPERDAGPVTWADYELMEAIQFLSRRVMELERIIKAANIDPRLWGDTTNKGE